MQKIIALDLNKIVFVTEQNLYTMLHIELDDLGKNKNASFIFNFVA